MRCSPNVQSRASHGLACANRPQPRHLEGAHHPVHAETPRRLKLKLGEVFVTRESRHRRRVIAARLVDCAVWIAAGAWRPLPETFTRQLPARSVAPQHR
jgi:hypothetical protein